MWYEVGTGTSTSNSTCTWYWYAVLVLVQLSIRLSEENKTFASKKLNTLAKSTKGRLFQNLFSFTTGNSSGNLNFEIAL
jgi:hypothetical protein